MGDAARRVFRVAGAAGRAAASQHGQAGEEQGKQHGAVRAGQIMHVFPFRWSVPGVLVHAWDENDSNKMIFLRRTIGVLPVN